MHQLIYVSEASPELSSGELFRIVEQSARNNPSADITGFLILREGRFLQLVEGPLLALDTLVDTLRRDPRHYSLVILSRVPIAERAFPRWRMKRVGESGDALAELELALAGEGGGRSLPREVRDFLETKKAA